MAAPHCTALHDHHGDENNCDAAQRRDTSTATEQSIWKCVAFERSPTTPLKTPLSSYPSRIRTTATRRGDEIYSPSPLGELQPRKEGGSRTSGRGQGESARIDRPTDRRQAASQTDREAGRRLIQTLGLLDTSRNLNHFTAGRRAACKLARSFVRSLASSIDRLTQSPTDRRTPRRTDGRTDRRADKLLSEAALVTRNSHTWDPVVELIAIQAIWQSTESAYDPIGFESARPPACLPVALPTKLNDKVL